MPHGLLPAGQESAEPLAFGSSLGEKIVLLARVGLQIEEPLLHRAVVKSAVEIFQVSVAHSPFSALAPPGSPKQRSVTVRPAGFHMSPGCRCRQAAYAGSRPSAIRMKERVKSMVMQT